MPESNACQLVLKYVVMNRSSFIKAYHNRVYAFSSGTKFSMVCDPIKKWIKTQQNLREKWEEDPPSDVEEDDENPHPDPVRALKKLNDVDDLQKLVGDTIINFMKIKPQPFLTNALRSEFPLLDPKIPSTSFINSLYVIHQFPLRHSLIPSTSFINSLYVIH